MMRAAIPRATCAVARRAHAFPSPGAAVTQSRRCTSTTVHASRSWTALGPPVAAGAAAAAVIALSLCAGGAYASSPASESPTVRAKKLAYEHKIRTLSPTARRFRYFATIEHNGAIYMTPRDFIDSMVGGNLQPTHLQIDQYSRVEGEYREADHMLPTAPSEKTLYAELAALIGRNVLISFADYMFLLSMMRHDARRFELAFKMFDRDGNGNIDRSEFLQVQSVMQAAAKASKMLQVKADRSLFLERFFATGKSFFATGSSSLSFDEFLTFCIGLRGLVAKFEFERNSKNGTMSVPSFVNLVIGNRGSSQRDTDQLVSRATEKLGKVTISYAEYQMFKGMVDNLDDVNTAISLFSAADHDVTQDDLLRAATVAGVVMTPKMINVLFVLFDADGNGTLSNKEFVKVMSQSASKHRRSVEVSFSRTFDGLMQCMKTLANGGSED